MMKADFVAGQRIWHLTAIKPSDERSAAREKQWLFRCDCGRDVIRPASGLLRGRPMSCGCKSRLGRVVKSDSNFNLAYHEYKKGARCRDHSWELSKDLVRVLFVGDCFYCGARPSIVVNHRSGDLLVRNGIDRLDPSIGYTSGNCVSCCSRCNYLKGTMSHVEFEQAIREIYTHLIA